MTQPTEVSVWLTGASVEVSQWAGRLGGICTEERENPLGIEQVFQFSLKSFAEKFRSSAHGYPEVLEVERSPSEETLDPRLCNCGRTKKLIRARECETPDLKQAIANQERVG